VIALAGLTAVADWLGSDASVFTYAQTPVSFDTYRTCSRERAELILDRAGWQRPREATPRTFEELFPGYVPRSLQTELATALEQTHAPCLVIIESTMGDGKTEAALLVAESLAPRAGQAGLYVGLPTQATSNQMLGRVERFLDSTALGRTNLHLVHGDAALSDQYRELRLRSIHGDTAASNVAAETWFAQSKRALLASHAVGTIDQSLMGVLQTKHSFVRLFALAGKTVVLDEVHAYDTYTSQLLDRLVAWLSCLGTTVVVLSATLPKRRRMQLIQKYGATPPTQEASYPRLTIASRNEQARSIGTSASRPSQRVRMQRVDDDLEGVARALCDAIKDGGTVAWICNTVARAQTAYAAVRNHLRSQGLAASVRLDLLHSRFLRKDRQAREREAERLYGPPRAAEQSARPERGILIGTQVLEQSLDLDFDLMVTDLSPIDLLLQRSGRLHRHERPRPAAHTEPVLWLVMPTEQDGLPDFRKVAGVYTVKAPDVIFRTWWELRGTTHLEIPESLEMWVERVYGDAGTRPTEPELLGMLETAERNAAETRIVDWRKAEQALLFEPDDAVRTDRFGSLGADLVEDESGDVHATLVANTRLAEPSADVVFLWDKDGHLSLDEGGTQRVSLDTEAHRDTRAFLEHSAKIELRRLRQLGGCVSQPNEWRARAALRFKWLLRLGEASLAAGVRVDAELGVIFGQKNGTDLDTALCGATLTGC
jgi:CRISPR-associated endonuclease/helicase Cas3